MKTKFYFKIVNENIVSMVLTKKEPEYTSGYQGRVCSRLTLLMRTIQKSGIYIDISIDIDTHMASYINIYITIK